MKNIKNALAEARVNRGVFFAYILILTALDMVIMTQPGTLRSTIAGASVCLFMSANIIYGLYKDNETADPERRSEENVRATTFYILLGALNAIAALAMVIFYLANLAIVSTIIGSVASIFYTYVSIEGWRKECERVRLIEEELKR